MNYADMMCATSELLRKTEELIERLDLEETIQKITKMEDIQKMLEEGFENCLNNLKYAVLFSNEEHKVSAERNLKAFESQKSRFMSDFLPNFKIVFGMNPIVYLSKNVKEDDVIRNIIMKQLDKSKAYEIAKKAIEYQKNGIMHKALVATFMNNTPENMTFELILAINLIDSESDTIMLPTSISFV